MTKEQLKKEFNEFVKIFIDKNGFPAYPNYDEMFDWWIVKLEEAYEKGKSKITFKKK